MTTVRYTVAAGLACIAGGLWQLSGATVASTYVSILPGLMLLGLGVGLAMPAATESVMGSLPGADTGVGAATNGAFMQTGGALGVAVIGSLLSTRYTGNIAAVLAPYHVPAAVLDPVRGSLGGALGVAARLGGRFGAELAAAARGRLRQRHGPGPADGRLRRARRVRGRARGPAGRQAQGPAARDPRRMRYPRRKKHP